MLAPAHLRFFSTELSAYTRRGRLRPALAFTPGAKVGPFQLVSLTPYPDFELTHLVWQHAQLPTRIHQLECAQQNNSLSMVFPTAAVRPGTGYALEKWLQCGSKAFPVRNLPMEMSLRSFSEEAGAQTTDGYLAFGFHSPILKDFSNLLRVYCSMVFQPLLREEDFYEVVRRLQFENGRLGLGGELAGELMEAQFRLEQTLYALISEELLGLPSRNLCKPLDLMRLSHQEVAEFHQQNVTLGNCTFLLHGDMDIHYFVEKLMGNVQEFQPSLTLPPKVNDTPRPAPAPKTINFDHLGQETILMLSYRIDQATPQQATLLQILSYLLFDMPESPFMRFLSPDTPYPALYGFRQRYFNVGITFHLPASPQQKHMQTAQTFREKQRIFIEKEKEVRELLQEICTKGLQQRLVEKCLFHLENNYYEKRGLSIIESITEKVLNGSSLDSVFQVTTLITNLLKDHRKNKVFESLIRKFLIDNPTFIVLRGTNNPQIIEQEQSRNGALLLQMQSQLPQQKLQQIAQYSPPTYLQDTSLLPQINPSELEYFEDVQGEEIKIKHTRTVYSPRSYGNRINFKFDVTDIGEDDIPLLALFCKAVPQMGYKGVKEEAYRELVNTYLGKLEMHYQTVRSEEGQMKIYVYLEVEFSDRNYEFAYSVLGGMFASFRKENIFALSRATQEAASHCFNEVSDNLLHYHGIHLAASRSPYAFFESPLFQARTLCAIAGDLKKTSNPKPTLMGLGHKFGEIWEKMVGYSRMEVFWQCKPERKDFYRRHLEILLGQVTNQGIPPEQIEVGSFPQQKWQKYFPNYDHEFAFEAFSVPFHTARSPSALVLSSLVNLSIAKFNRVGGCFLYKGALVSFIQGNRQKYLELEDHYKRTEHIDVAKRKIFQHFGRYTVEQQFKSGVSLQQARFFKEAVLAVQQSDVQQTLQQYLLNPIKQGSSSLLALGPRLQNYQPLLRKNWQIERSIDDVSLSMQSLSRQEVQFKLERYIDIC